jgi:hypothetical protein
MTIHEAGQLKKGDTLDHRDDVGRFAMGTVVRKILRRVRIHYENWGSEWDVWSDYEKELHRFAKYQSISQRPPHRFQSLVVGAFLYFNPPKHPG